jgi:hypothetical protein
MVRLAYGDENQTTDALDPRNQPVLELDFDMPVPNNIPHTGSLPFSAAVLPLPTQIEIAIESRTRVKVINDVEEIKKASCAWRRPAS